MGSNIQIAALEGKETMGRSDSLSRLTLSLCDITAK
jgi:hypothetical protein